jgi:transposase
MITSRSMQGHGVARPIAIRLTPAIVLGVLLLAAGFGLEPWLELAYLPSYTPELDPVEGLWANFKGCELANRCCADRAELISTAQVGSIRVRRDPELLRSFLAGTGLTL